MSDYNPEQHFIELPPELYRNPEHDAIRQWSIKQYRKVTKWKIGLLFLLFVQLITLIVLFNVSDLGPAFQILEGLLGVFMLVSNPMMYYFLRKKQRSYVLTDEEIEQLIEATIAERAQRDQEFEDKFK